jgi:hypothetical protein
VNIQPAPQGRREHRGQAISIREAWQNGAYPPSIGENAVT